MEPSFPTVPENIALQDLKTSANRSGATTFAAGETCSAPVPVEPEAIEEPTLAPAPTTSLIEIGIEGFEGEGAAWLTFGQLMKSAWWDRKLLIIRIVFYLEVIPWLGWAILMGMHVYAAAFATDHDYTNYDYDDRDNVNKINWLKVSIPFILATAQRIGAPLGLVWLIAYANWRLQAVFRKQESAVRLEQRESAAASVTDTITATVQTVLSANSNLNTTAHQKFAKLTEDVWWFSRALVLAALISGSIISIVLLARLFFNVMVHQEYWSMQGFFHYLFYFLTILEIVLQKSFPLVVTVAQLRAFSKLSKSNGDCDLVFKNLDDVQKLGSISSVVLIENFGGDVPAQIVQKFKRAGIRAITFNSNSEAQIGQIQELVLSGDVVAVLGHNHVDILVDGTTSTGTAVTATPMPMPLVRVAKILLNFSKNDSTLTKDLKSILKCVTECKNMNHNISRFIQLLTPTVIAIVLAKIISRFFSSNDLVTFAQILWISFLVLILGLTFVLETPATTTTTTTGRRPDFYLAKCGLVNKIMVRNMVGQIVYQFIILLILIFLTGTAFGEPNYSDHVSALVSNTITLMAFFNAFNCRVIHGEINICANLLRLSRPFCVVWSVAIIIHTFAVSFGMFHDVLPLLPSDILICYAFAVGTLLWAQLVNCVPVAGLTAWRWKNEPRHYSTQDAD